MPVSVSVVNDFSVVVAGVRALLEPYADRVEVVDTELGTSPGTPVDLALFDSFSAPLDWQARLADMCRFPGVGAVAVYSFLTDPRAVEDSLRAGASGFLAKSLHATDLVTGIERIVAGEQVVELGEYEGEVRGDHWPGEDVGLTPREAEMIALIVRGYSNEEIATSRYLSPNTVKSYIREAYRKIRVNTRAQAVAWGMRNGLAPAP